MTFVRNLSTDKLFFDNLYQMKRDNCQGCFYASGSQLRHDCLNETDIDLMKFCINTMYKEKKIDADQKLYLEIFISI